MTALRCRAAIWLLALSANAQNDSGVVTGKVFNSEHLPVAAATVLVEQEGKTLASGVTDVNGGYRFSLAAGKYALHCGKVEHSAAIVGGQTLRVDLAMPSEQPEFLDEPTFTVAGVTDNTYRGGHGSDSVLRSSETLTKATASLGNAGAAAEPHHDRAQAEERAGHPVEAAKEFQKAAELNPSEQNLFDWGTELLSHQAPQAALEVFGKGGKLFPKSVRMVLGQAASWYAAGAYDKAAHCFFEAIDMNPSDLSPYQFLMEARAREVMESPGYHERFAEFAKLQPNSPQANYYYGRSLWEEHKSAEAALGALAKSVTLDPHLAAAYLEMGVIHSSQREFAEAVSDYRMAVGESADSEEAHYRLSEAYRMTGDRANAERELAIFQRLSTESAEKLERDRKEVRRFVIALKNTR